MIYTKVMGEWLILKSFFIVQEAMFIFWLCIFLGMYAQRLVSLGNGNIVFLHLLFDMIH